VIIINIPINIHGHSGYFYSVSLILKKYIKSCNLFVYSEEEILRKSLKINYSDDSEVTENLQKKQRMVLAAGDNYYHSVNHTPRIQLNA